MERPIQRIIGFCCKNALDSLGGKQYTAGKGRFSFEPAVKIVQLPCSSKIETFGIIKAFESGADGIFVLGCADEKCRLLDGNYRARKIVNHTKGLLSEVGVVSERLEMFQLGTSEGQQIDEIIHTMVERLKTLGNLLRELDAKEISH